MNRQNVIAIISDCDDTLCEDTTTFLIRKLGLDSEVFWRSVNRTVSKGWDPPLAYMRKIIRLTSRRQIDLTNAKLRRLGANLKFFPGVTKMFDELHSMVQDEFNSEILLEFYVITCGFEEVIKGSQIAPYLKGVFGCTFDVYPKTGKLRFPKSIVTFTEKTKFIFAINKGISGETLRKRPYEVNSASKEDERPVPFCNMIYIGDGPSDIPCFSLVMKNGGHGIGVFRKGAVKKGYQLAKGKRLTVGPYPCDYRRGKSLRTVLEQIIKEVGLGILRRKEITTIPPPSHS